MARVKNGVHEWLYDSEKSGKFLMLPPELFEEPAFQGLSYAARQFYILLNVHHETEIQRKCLYAALQDYNRIYSLGLTENEILDEAMPNKRTRYNSGYFVAPQKHLQAYGYTGPYAAKLKKELEKAGFIRAVYGKKGRYGGWNQNVTVYQFLNDWKTKCG